MMIRRKICEVTFIASLLLLVATSETLWTIPIFFIGVVASVVIGKLWENTKL